MKAMVIACILSIGCGSAGSYQPVSSIEDNEAGVDATPQVQPFLPGELCCQVAGEGLAHFYGDASDINNPNGIECYGANGNVGVVVYCVWSPGGGSSNGNGNPPSLEQKTGSKLQ